MLTAQTGFNNGGFLIGGPDITSLALPELPLLLLHVETWLPTEHADGHACDREFGDAHGICMSSIAWIPDHRI